MKIKKTVNFLSLWLPVALYLLLIFYLSAQTNPPQLEWDVPFLDKIEHMILYGVLGLILYRALFFTWGSSARLSWVVILILVLYGVSDEIHQSFVPLRSPEVMDVVFDGLGGLVALHPGFFRKLVTRPPGERFSFLLECDS